MTLRKIYFFVIEKSVEDVNRMKKFKDVPDLLEAIMRPTDPVKEELRRNLCKLSQFAGGANGPAGLGDGIRHV